MPVELIDSHCHIPLIEVPGGHAAVVNEAAACGITHMLCVAIDLESWPGVMDLARKYSCISASVGVHPNSTGIREPGVDDLVRLAADENVVAIGETGLDYFRSSGDLKWQRDRLRTHIRAAREIGKPLIIHSREASDDLLDILRSERAAEVGGVMHCFTGDRHTALRAIDLNFHISFSGIVTYKSAVELQQVARELPLERMLIETDSPYLAPVPHRGRQNQPAYVYHVAECIADLRGEDLALIGCATSENFRKLFLSGP